MDLKKISSYLIIVLLFAFYSYTVTQKINLANVDLGRHLKNGELVLSNFALTKINFYSYTFPNFTFINHHWGTGLIFNIVKSLFGFSGLSIFYTLLCLTTLAVFYYLAYKKTSHEFSVILGLLLVPVLGSRSEIRPEIFSYLFAGIYFLILSQYKNNLWNKKILYLMPLLSLFWVNLHIYFLFGIGLIGLFLLDELFNFLRDKQKFNHEKTKKLILVFVLSITASLINPNFINGLLYPLNIFREYGYKVVENQSVWFLAKVVGYTANFYFVIIFLILVCSWILYLYKNKFNLKSLSYINLILSLLLSVLAWFAVRNFSLFAFFCFPIIAGNLQPFNNEIKKYLNLFNSAIIITILLFLIIILKPSYWQEKKAFGIGLYRGVDRAAVFFKAAKIRGPIFNNYDIGSYLIYYLYPQEKVFVDNRPEAYPVDFFKDIYIPMQENPQIWQQMQLKYQFNAVFFYYHDITPWAQTFLVSLLDNQDWAPVYADGYNIIFVKNDPRNQKIIEKFKLPREVFKTNKQ